MAKRKRKNPRPAERSVQAHQRMMRALELRKAGVGYIQIAETLGYGGPSGAYKAVHSALKMTLREPADELRALELERLDRASVAIAQAVGAGNFGAIDRLLRIMERRAKLLGLDRPTLTSTLNIDWAQLTDEQLDRIIAGEEPLAVLAGTSPRRA